jgi:hypothetical protein
MKLSRLQVSESTSFCLMVSLAFILLLLASVGGEAHSLKNTIHGQQVAQDHAAQAHRLQGLALLVSSSSVTTNGTLLSTTVTSSSLSTATTSGTARPTTAAAATGITNADSTVVGFSIYSASNLPTGVLKPPSSCADALMATIECDSTILLMGYDLSCTAIIVHDDQHFTESTRLSTLLVSRQCVPPHARHPSNPTGLTS